VTVAAIVLAAGASRRMGSPKPLLPWGGATLLAWELDELLRSCVDDIVVVLGSRAEDVRRSLGDGARYCVFNPRWQQGRATSLVAGARALQRDRRPTPDVIMIQDVDRPTRHDIIDRLVDELRSSAAEIVQPSFRGEPGHPIVLRGRLLPELIEARDETFGLRAVVERHERRYIPMDEDPVVMLNLNTPDTVEEGRRLLGVAGA
jgi:molybdenum cofactor cytidylyltransferase